MINAPKTSRMAEVRAFLAEAERRASRHADPSPYAREVALGGVAAMLIGFFGCKPKEVLIIRTRHVADAGRLLTLDDTEARTDHQIETPEVLRGHMARLAAGKDGGALVFGDRDRAWLVREVKSIAMAAGVSIDERGLRLAYAAAASAATRSLGGGEG